MPGKVAINETTPGQAKTATCKDALGRTIVIRKVTALARYDLVKIIPPGQAENAALMSMAFAAFSVVSIDGEAQPIPRTEPELRAAIGELDDEGLSAIGECYAAQGWLPKEADPDTVKNS